MKEPDTAKGIPITDPAELLLVQLIEGNNAKNCMVVGTRIRKVNSVPGDFAENGHLGTVLGSIYDEAGYPVPGSNRTVKSAYLVNWDGSEAAKVFILDFKIEEVKDGN